MRFGFSFWLFGICILLQMNGVFADTVQVAIGEHEGVRRKPEPDMVYEALRRLGVEPAEAVYVGDSDVDVETARRAGLSCISVLWGFRDREFLDGHGAMLYAASPAEVAGLVMGT